MIKNVLLLAVLGLLAVQTQAQDPIDLRIGLEAINYSYSEEWADSENDDARPHVIVCMFTGSNDCSDGDDLDVGNTRVFVKFWTTDITADSPEDYAGIAEDDLLLEFNNDKQWHRIELDYVNDTVVENTERFRVYIAHSDTVLDVIDASKVTRVSLAPTIGQATILDVDNTVVRLDYYGVETAERCAISLPSTGPRIFDPHCSEPYRYTVAWFPESYGNLPQIIRVGPNLIEYGISFVVKSRDSNQSLALQDSFDLYDRLEFDYITYCNRGFEAHDKDPEECALLVPRGNHGADKPEFSETIHVPSNATEQVVVSQGSPAVYPRISDDDRPDGYRHISRHCVFNGLIYSEDASQCENPRAYGFAQYYGPFKVEHPYYAVKAYDTVLQRNGAQDDIRMHHTNAKTIIIDDDPSFVIAKKEINQVGDNLSLPISLGYKIPVDATVIYTWGSYLDGPIQQGQATVPAGQVRTSVPLPPLENDNPKYLELSILNQGAILNNEHAEDQVELFNNDLLSFARYNNFVANDRNPVYLAPEGDYLRWRPNRIEIDVALARPARRGFRDRVHIAGRASVR